MSADLGSLIVMVNISNQLHAENARTTHPLPAGVVFAESAIAAMRKILRQRGMGGFQIYLNWQIVNQVAELIGKQLPECAWEPIPSLVGAEPLQRLDREGESFVPVNSGLCVIARFHVAMARIHWIDTNQGHPHELLLVAARSIDDINRLHRFIVQCAHSGAQASWQVVGSGGYCAQRIARPADVVEPLLEPAIRDRVEADILGFFSDDAARMYRSLGIAYRRGVLLHGPPGNGKTSLIRFIGGKLPTVSAMLLRSCAGFDSDDLQSIIALWAGHAPSMLVIEDLDWLLKQVNVSTFLNLLDGVDHSSNGAQLLLATTNHPEQLDPAINNRPGRFDVVMELPLPSAPLRDQFFQRHLPSLDESSRSRIVAKTDKLSFSHLLEIVRLSGLIAIRAHRSDRTIDDLNEATKLTRQSHDSAQRGFVRPPDSPFGLQYLRKESQED